MKKRYGVLTCLMLVMALTGCGGNNAETSPEPSAADLSGEKAIFEDMQLPTPEPVEETDSSDGTDVDLSVMSSTMVYSEVYNMMTEPEDYIGKRIKMNGSCATYHDEQTGKDYYACIVKDATACCSQGIEFELKKPDYPKPDDEITVVGTFQTYVEGEDTYCVLKNAKLL